MGITAASLEQYKAALKKLFPQGEYWNAQFADPASDASLFCEAKLDAFIRFRLRMGRLYDESLMEKTDELIGDWERAMLGKTFPGLPLEQRRAALRSRLATHINKREIRRIGLEHSVIVFAITFPRASSAFPLVHAWLDGTVLAFAENIVAQMLSGAKFGSARFGMDRLAFVSGEYAAWLFVKAGLCAEFETEVQSKMLANQTTSFQYHIQWEDEAAGNAAARPYPRGGEASFIGDIAYDETFFVYKPQPGRLVDINSTMLHGG